MKGIYIHIPFCRKACRYCDFFFTVSLKYLDSFVDTLVKEIGQNGESGPFNALETLYLGGGTPSVLSPSQLDRIINAIHRYYTFTENPEWTIECNPDDLDLSRIKMFQTLGFNRLSIGIQSFHNRDLDIMNRSHDAVQAEASVRRASSYGFDNISIDLIYGVPGQSFKEWAENLEKALNLPVSHLSAYHLTFEQGTVFDHWRKQGRLAPVTDEQSVRQYRILREKLVSAGFDHYELSNFGRGGKVSEHNMLYWSGKPYLGMGPSAHSYDGDRRSWNISSLQKYIECIASGKEVSNTELLSVNDKYHDYLITSLRTKWGADPVYIEQSFGKKYGRHFESKAGPFLESGKMFEEGGRVAIDPEGWLICDHILRALFMD